MTHWTRSWAVAVATVFALAAVPGAMTSLPSGSSRTCWPVDLGPNRRDRLVSGQCRL